MEPLPPLDRRSRPIRLRANGRRALRWMLAGSLVLHLLALLALWLSRPVPPQDDSSASDEIAMVFESPGAKEASVSSPAAEHDSAIPVGNVNATTVQPNPDTSPPPPPPPLTQAPPAPTQAAQPSPPEQQVQEPPPPAQPTPEAPPATPPPLDAVEPAEPPQPVPTPSVLPPRPQSTVTLSQEVEPDLLPLPRFVMPQAPPPLPSLLFPPPRPVSPRPVSPRPITPSPALPRQFARPTPSNPFAGPQDFSFNQAPSSQAPSPRASGRSSRGFDMSTGDFSGQKDATLGYVSGARPSGDWMGLLRRWATARLYYPDQAIADHQQGTAVVLLTIDRSGRVLNVQLLQSARSPFLDGAWIDVFRGATVPAFTPDMPDESTKVTYTLHYRLVSH